MGTEGKRTIMKIALVAIYFFLTTPLLAEINQKFGAYGNPPDKRFPLFRIAHSDLCGNFIDNPQLSAAQNLINLKAVCLGSTLPVGELEGRTYGPYSMNGIPFDFGKLFTRWNFLVAFKSDVPTKKVNCDFWCGLRSGLDYFAEWGQGLADLTSFYNNATIDIEIANKIGEAAKGETYAVVMDKLGVASDERSREAVLDKRLTADGGERLKRLILNFERANNTKTIIFEIANEPNLFPYIPSKLYAIYYRRWVMQIFNAMVSINLTRSEDNYLIPKFIPGGLFISDGLPLTVTSVLTGFIRSPVFEVGMGHVSAETYQQSFVNYLNGFSDLNNPGWVLYDASTVAEQAWSLRGMPYKMGFTSHFHCPKSDPCCVQDPCRFYWYPISFLSYANLHFYPYTAVESTMPDINQHLSNLDRIINLTVAGTEYSKAIFTEVGTLNPYTPLETSWKIVPPMTNYFKSNPKVSSFFWFKSQGYDTKFDGLKKVKTLSDFVPGFVSQYFNGNIPYPALFEENSLSLSPIGCKYYESAGYPVKLSAAGKCFWPGASIATLSLLNN